MKGMLKWPLILAAVFIIARIVLEQAGAPDSINNLVSVVVLYVFVFPLYFAVRIARSNVARPYATLLKMTALYAALARAMVAPTYWLAYMYGWTQPRFSQAQGGVVGPDITPLLAVLIPFGAMIVWVLASLIIGGGLGSIVIAIKRKSAKPSQVLSH